jgi:hypothetical protein
MLPENSPFWLAELFTVGLLDHCPNKKFEMKNTVSDAIVTFIHLSLQFKYSLIIFSLGRIFEMYSLESAATLLYFLTPIIETNHKLNL